MPRILGIDYGTKRTGVAVTDPLKMIASPLDTIDTHQLLPYIHRYLKNKEVEHIVIGLPKSLNNEPTDATKAVEKFAKRLKSQIAIPITFVDERFTSKMAFQAMIDGGMKKKNRRNKSNIDKLSATIILQSYLEGGGTF